MKRTSINLLIDFLATTLLVGMVATGYILFFTLPPGTNKSLSLWSLTRHQWGQVHSWISLGLLLVLLLHLALHWEWVVATVAQRLGLARTPQSRHFRSGVITLLILVTALGLFAWVTKISVRGREDSCCLPSADSDTTTNTLNRNKTKEVVTSSHIDFWKQLYPILENSCLRCHGPKKEQGGFRIDQREDYFGTNGKVALVIPGKSAESPLIAIVQGLRTEMAMAASHKLPKEQIAILRAWIDAGADWPDRQEDK